MLFEEMPRVLNMKDYPNGLPPNSVFVGRPSDWGNPFIIGKDGSRNCVIGAYEGFLSFRPDLIQRAKTELRGKNLVCFCAPKRCHADILLRIANND